MLDKVPAPELIPTAVESSIRPYCLEHQIPFDEMLLQYIKVLTHQNQIHGGENTTLSKLIKGLCCSEEITFCISLFETDLGSAGALQFSDHNTIYRVGG